MNFNFTNIVEGQELPEYIKNLSKITDEFNAETNRGMALFAAILLDDALRDLLIAFLAPGKGIKEMFKPMGALGTFSARQAMCLALGLISQREYDNCQIIRSIRNKFAHESGFKINFSNQNIADLCKKFPLYEKFFEIVDPGVKDFFNKSAFTFLPKEIDDKLESSQKIEMIKEMLIKDTSFINQLNRQTFEYTVAVLYAKWANRIEYAKANKRESFNLNDDFF